ncbi:MAG: ribonuclease P protein component [Candidatus Rifleibacteriota bacterium]
METTPQKGRSTLRTHSEFKRVFNEGFRFFRNGLGFCVRKTSESFFRFGISVPKRFGKAVERNQIKRRIREIIRTSDELPEKTEVVFFVRKPCRELSFEDLKKICAWAFKRINYKADRKAG